MRLYLDPLTAEQFPDGTFGGARPRRRDRRKPVRTSEAVAARHRAELLAELYRPRPRKDERR
jgi:hypothetical protein